MSDEAIEICSVLYAIEQYGSTRSMNAAIVTVPVKSSARPRSANGIRNSMPVVAVLTLATLDAVMPALFVLSKPTSTLFGLVPPASVPFPELRPTVPRKSFVASVPAFGSTTRSTNTSDPTVFT